MSGNLIQKKVKLKNCFCFGKGTTRRTISVLKRIRILMVSSAEDFVNLTLDCLNLLASFEREILWAANEDMNEVVEGILETEPSSVHATDRDGYTPLHKACYNNNFELAQILLKYKADPNRRTEFQWTALHSACKWNNSKLAALVLQHGADINARSEGDQTPLHVTTSVSACRDTLVTLFMNPNLKPNLRNNSDETAHQIAKRTGLTLPLFDMIHPALFVETGQID